MMLPPFFGGEAPLLVGVALAGTRPDFLGRQYRERPPTDALTGIGRDLPRMLRQSPPLLHALEICPS